MPASSQICFEGAGRGRGKDALISRRTVRLQRVERAQLGSQLHEAHEWQRGCHLCEAQLGRAEQQIVADTYERAARQRGRPHMAPCGLKGVYSILVGNEQVQRLRCECEHPFPQPPDLPGKGLAGARCFCSRSCEGARLGAGDIQAVHRQRSCKALDVCRSSRPVPRGDRRPAEQGVEPSRFPAFCCCAMR